MTIWGALVASLWLLLVLVVLIPLTAMCAASAFGVLVERRVTWRKAHK